MGASAKQIAEQHLVSLWSAVRDAAALLRRGEGELLGSSQLAPLLQALAVDARRLARLIERRGVELSPELEAEPMAFEGRPRVLVVADAEPKPPPLSPDFDVVRTADLAQVLSLIREGAVDAVLTDAGMPGLDGLALLELIQREVTHSPPVLLTTDALDERLRLDALELGAFDVLERAVATQELTARLHRAVRYGRELDRQRQLLGTDELTGLLNRRAFKAALTSALKDRRSGSPALSVAMIDQDGLKRVNDLYGHARGDEALAAIALALKRVRRSTDLAARIGGDEFALLMPGTDRLGAGQLLERLTQELASNPLPLRNGGALPLTVSYGLATLDLSDRFTDGAALLERADVALYQMKRHKRSGSEADATHTTH